MRRKIKQGTFYEEWIFSCYRIITRKSKKNFAVADENRELRSGGVK